MRQTVRIGIIGDYDPAKASHPPTVAALEHAAGMAGTRAEVAWIGTKTLDAPEGLRGLQAYDALMAAPGSPYDSLTGALDGIKEARLSGKPFLGT